MPETPPGGPRRAPRRAALRAAAALALLLAVAPAWAGIPEAYAPMVVEPVGAPQRWSFDLSPALARAQREGKRLYVYLGADNCRYCRRYETFLAGQSAALKPAFDQRKWLIVDLRSTLSATEDRIFLRAGGREMGYREFQRTLGDERERRLVYPLVWLLDAQGRSLMQMPSGAGTFETVPEQIEILDLQQ